MNTNQEILARLKAKYPTLGLSHGYIGNCGVNCYGPFDDRSWRLFTTVRVHPDDVNCAQVYLDGPDIDEAKAIYALDTHIAMIKARELGYFLQIKRRTVVDAMSGKKPYRWEISRINGGGSAFGDFDTATEAVAGIPRAK